MPSRNRSAEACNPLPDRAAHLVPFYQGITLRLLAILPIVAFAAPPATGGDARARVLQSARWFLDHRDISYGMGGHRVGSEATCSACSQCLARVQESKASPQCPACHQCSLDCSHFVQFVFARAGMRIPYLTTAVMLSSSAEVLRQRFGLITLGDKLHLARPGDLLVYRGHVAILERKRAEGRGDIIHATAGQAVRAPGQGIQRALNIDLRRQPKTLRLILRHERLGVPLRPAN